MDGFRKDGWEGRGVEERGESRAVRADDDQQEAGTKRQILQEIP